MRKNQYQCMSELQNSLKKLYDIIHYSPKEVSIESPDGIMQALIFAKRGMPANYLEMLTVQVKKAIKILDGMRLDVWSEKEHQEETIEKQSKRIEELENRLRDYELSPVKNVEKEMKDLICNIISLRDGQLIKRDYLYDQGEQEGSAAMCIVEATLKETANLLKKSGVEILEDQGMFSSQRQTIVDVKETEDEALDGQIAEVVRPGYFYQGEQLRGQEVIIYKMKK